MKASAIDGVELAAAAGLHHRDRPSTPQVAVVHLDHVGELGDPHRDRDGVAAGTAGQTATVEALEGVTQRLLDIGVEPHPLGQQRRRRAVRVDQSATVGRGH